MTRTRRHLVRAIITAWALLGGGLLILIVLATALNAAGFTADAVAGLWGGSVRGLSGYEDGVTMLVGVAALAMFPFCQLHSGHAAVDVLMSKAPKWANTTIDIVSAVLTVSLALGMAVMLTLGMLDTRSDRVETAVLGWQVWIFMAPAIVSCLLWAMAALEQVITPAKRADGT